MKKNVVLILAGVTALHVVIFGGLFASGGCKNVVMDERRYIPAENPQTPEAMEPMNAMPPAADFRPAEPQTRPVAAETYKPMETFVAKPVAEDVKGGTYVVKAGDTLGAVARANGVSLSAMLKANGLDLNSARRIRVGQKLIVPGKGEVVAPKTVKSVKAAAKTVKAGTALAADGTYVVKAGDSIPKIARKLGIKASDLQKANNLSDEATRYLQIGQKLVIPGKGAAVAVPEVKKAPETVPAETAPAAPVLPKQEETDIDLSAALNDAANAATAPAVDTATPAAEIVIGNSTPVEVTSDVTLEVFAANNGTTVEALKKLNTDLPADGNLKQGLILFVPAAK